MSVKKKAYVLVIRLDDMSWQCLLHQHHTLRLVGYLQFQITVGNLLSQILIHEQRRRRNLPTQISQSSL